MKLVLTWYALAVLIVTAIVTFESDDNHLSDKIVTVSGTLDLDLIIKLSWISSTIRTALSPLIISRLFDRIFFLKSDFDPNLPNLIRILTQHLHKKRFPLDKITVELALDLHDRLREHRAVRLLRSLQKALQDDGALADVVQYERLTAAHRFIIGSDLPEDIVSVLQSQPATDQVLNLLVERCTERLQEPSSLKALIRCGIRFPAADFAQVVDIDIEKVSSIVPLLGEHWISRKMLQTLTESSMVTLLQKTLVAEHIRRRPMRFLIDIRMKPAIWLKEVTEIAPELFNEIVNRVCSRFGDKIAHLIWRSANIWQFTVLLTVPSLDLTARNTAGLIPIQSATNHGICTLPISDYINQTPSLIRFLFTDAFHDLIHDKDRRTIGLLSANRDLLNAIKETSYDEVQKLRHSLRSAFSQELPISWKKVDHLLAAC